MKAAEKPERAGFRVRTSGRSRRAVRPGTIAVMRSFQPHALAIQETPASPFTRILLWTLVGLLVVAATWAWIGRIPIMTTAPGKFLNDAHLEVVQSMNTGTVSRILVKAGDAVRKGTVLVTLDPHVNSERYVSDQEALSLNLLERQRALFELGKLSHASGISGAASAAADLESHLAAAQVAAQRSKVADDRAQLKEAVANLAAGEATLGEYQDRLSEDSRLSKAAEPTVSEGAISGKDYVDLEDQVIDDEGKLAAQRKKMEQLSAAVSGAKSGLDKDVRQFKADRYRDLETATSKRFDLGSQYAQAEQAVEMDMLRAPVDGTVQSLSVASLGTVVQSGQTVATVEPFGTRGQLIVEVDLPAEDAGFVRVGQATQIKVTAYPFEQYGSIPGKVVWISPTAESTSDLSSLAIGESHQADPPASRILPETPQTGEPAPPTLYYRIKISPARTWLDIEGQRRTVRSGMTVRVDIATGHRRILNFFLDPIVKYVHNGMVVR